MFEEQCALDALAGSEPESVCEGMLRFWAESTRGLAQAAGAATLTSPSLDPEAWSLRAERRARRLRGWLSDLHGGAAGEPVEAAVFVLGHAFLELGLLFAQAREPAEIVEERIFDAAALLGRCARLAGSDPVAFDELRAPPVASGPRGPPPMSSAQLSVARGADGAVVVHLGGAWLLRAARPSPEELEAQLDAARVPRLAFDTGGLAGWDSALVAFLARVLRTCQERGIAAERGGLPEGVRRLLALAEAVPERAGARGSAPPAPWLARLGNAAVGFAGALGAPLAFLGETTLAVGRLASSSRPLPAARLLPLRPAVRGPGPARSSR